MVLGAASGWAACLWCAWQWVLTELSLAEARRQAACAKARGPGRLLDTDWGQLHLASQRYDAERMQRWVATWCVNGVTHSLNVDVYDDEMACADDPQALVLSRLHGRLCEYITRHLMLRELYDRARVRG